MLFLAIWKQDFIEVKITLYLTLLPKYYRLEELFVRYISDDKIRPVQNWAKYLKV
jgi:hypothetical protein